jgi:hypothetical protein
MLREPRRASPSARLRASSTRYGGALLSRGRNELRACNGPGSAEQREERCTASGTQLAFATHYRKPMLNPPALMEPVGFIGL